MCFLTDLSEIGINECDIEKISIFLGGECRYIPKGLKWRNAEIVRRFDGENYRQLAKEYNLGTRQIRMIVDKK